MVSGLEAAVASASTSAISRRLTSASAGAMSMSDSLIRSFHSAQPRALAVLTHGG